jgi:hypothetical protein
LWCKWACKWSFFFQFVRANMGLYEDSVNAEQLSEYLNWCVLPWVLHVVSHWYSYTYSDRNCYSVTKKWKSVVCLSQPYHEIQCNCIQFVSPIFFTGWTQKFLHMSLLKYSCVHGSEIILFTFPLWMRSYTDQQGKE